MSPAPENRTGAGDLPPDLERLRTLEAWLVRFLGRHREKIVALERPAGPGRTPDWGITDAGTGVGRPPPRFTGRLLGAGQGAATG
ncbi:hypothetical protein [Streptomyces sp. st140]|uniref:hypothetical protein n=1 Tax=Streptomyces sp. st140 TaxID=1828052 RepID=UPI00211D962A|nr:hypothetical protein [Streptomyces sp. st140]